MQDWIVNVMDQYGYIGVALLILIENLFPPIPSEIVLTFGGFMTTVTSMNMWLVSLFATIGSVAGAVILYYVGRLVSPHKLGLFVDKWGHILRVKKSDLKKADDWFAGRGKITVFLCRFIPVVRSLISIPAGVARMNLPAFLFWTTLGTAIWNIVLVYLGALARENWQLINEYVSTYSYLIWIVIAAVLVIYLLVKRFKKKAERKDSE